MNVVLEEEAMVVNPATRHAAELLGLDPLEVANEGKVVVVVRPAAAREAVRVMREHMLGRQAGIIGRIEIPVGTQPRGELVTRIGGRRIISKPYGEQLPRIC